MFNIPNQPLGSAGGTLGWFMARSIARLSSESALTLAQAEQHIADEFSLGSWAGVVEFSRDCAVLLDRHTVQYERRLTIHRDVAWQWLTDPELLAKWHFPTEMDFRVGGAFEFKEAWRGVIGAIEDQTLVRFDAEQGGQTTFSLSERRGVLYFRLIDFMAPNLVVPDHVRMDGDSVGSHQPGGPGTHWRGVLAGWHYGANSLRELVAGSTFGGDYEELVRIYHDLMPSYYASLET